MTKLSLIVVLLLVGLSLGRIKRASRGIDFKNWWLSQLRTPPKTTTSTTTTRTTTSAPKTTINPAKQNGQVVIKDGFNWRDINSTDKFYDKFQLDRLPQHKEGYKRPGSGISSSGLVDPFDPRLLCFLRPTLIELPKPSFGQFIFPSCAVVNRCGGCCAMYTHQSCRPTSVKMTPIYYYQLESSGNSGMSMSVDPGMTVTSSLRLAVEEEHLGCACQCQKTAASCNRITQHWNEDHCECECNRDYQRENMPCSSGLEYDSSTCSCVCARAREHCSRNKKWSDSDCGCLCRENSTCPVGQDRDPTSCRCVPI